MKKNFKVAFSLAELLIAITIISILTVMMINISKRGVENAYNIYYYTGYKAMNDAISYNNERNTSGDKLLHLNYIAEAFGFSGIPDVIKNMPPIVTTNGVTYQITYRTSKRYDILMTIPSAKGDTQVNLIYFSDNGGILLPKKVTLPDNSTFNLYERKDLLPFYIDDGNKGRASIKHCSSSTNCSPRYEDNNKYKISYASFKDNYCSLKDDYINTKVRTMLSCGAIQKTNIGYLKLANPRKL